MGLLVGAVFGPAGLIAGIVAVTRAQRLGALGISISSIVSGATVTILTLPWLIGWIALGVAGAASGP
jgi:predicted transcriptional regulator